MLDLEATDVPHRWRLTIENKHCTGPVARRFLFGGIGMAASIQALEKACERPVIWATAQYLSFAGVGMVLDVDVKTQVSGRLTSQANVLVHNEEKNILSVQAALGARENDSIDQWVAMPNVRQPEDCEEARYWRGDGSGLNARIEIRVALGAFHGDPRIRERGDGRLVFWLRSREGHTASASLLAIAADYVASGIAGATGLHAGGNSLDNTIRYANIVPCEWILCDVMIESLTQGIVHGRIRLYSPDGILMAIASQSMILRVHTRPQ